VNAHSRQFRELAAIFLKDSQTQLQSNDPMTQYSGIIKKMICDAFRESADDDNTTVSDCIEAVRIRWQIWVASTGVDIPLDVDWEKMDRKFNAVFKTLT
jgi:hypothetical protein